MKFLVAMLATARLTRLIVEDDITLPLRDAAHNYHPKLGQLVSCRSCTSVWAALVVSVTMKVSSTIPRMFALSESAILLREYVDGD